MPRLRVWLRNRADDVAVALLTALFGTFVVQILSRYLFGAPVGWTVELCLTAWLWGVFWVAAFCLGDRDHVRFDILYEAAGTRLRRILAGIAALAIAGGLLASMPATWDYISFYRIKKSATLHLRLDYVFSIYGVFAAAIVLRYLWRAARLLRGAAPDADAPEETGRP